MRRRGLPSLPPVLLVLLFATLWFAGGSSRNEVPGQILVQFVTWGTLFLAVLLAPPPASDTKAVLWLLVAIALVPLVQLIPLPPAIWQALPGHAALSEAARVSGQAQPWRPIAVVPGATLNALFALATPAAVLLLVAGLKESSRGWLLGLIVALVTGAALVGLVQFSGNRFEQPLIGYRYDVSGIFGNRNHFALFLAIGCMAVFAWSLGKSRGIGWRGALALGLPVLFVLTALASGSRAGTAATFAALILGPLTVRENIRGLLIGRPRWVVPTLIAGSLLLAASAITLSFVSGRADSIDRAVGGQIAEDMRARGLPTILTITRDHFPVGIGMGGFDPVFRRYEPFELLKPTWFNQAHNDVLAAVLEGGLPGLLVLLLAVFWWLHASVVVWRPLRKHDPVAGQIVRARFGSAVLALVFVASLVDYPGRAPLMSATTALAAALLAWGWTTRRPSSLPQAERPI